MGEKFLRHKNCDLAADMFVYSLRDVGHGNFRSQYNEIKEKLKKKIKASKAYSEYCTELIKNVQKKNFKPEVIEFKSDVDKDLFYSVQHADVNYDIKKVDKRYNLKLKFSDTYDFTVWRPFLDSFANVANDMEVILQDGG